MINNPDKIYNQGIDSYIKYGKLIFLNIIKPIKIVTLYILVTPLVTKYYHTDDTPFAITYMFLVIVSSYSYLQDKLLGD